MDLNDFPHVRQIRDYLSVKFPYFSKVIDKRYSDFGDSWIERFEKELDCFFLDDKKKLQIAAHGYGMFTLDGLRLQKKFDKTLQYENKRYEDLKQEVYLNEEYMFSLYLPGILLSHYLWPHHYRQLLWFNEEFVPLVRKDSVKKFCDVGVGTGFYSKEMLRNFPRILGHGHDISDHPLKHTMLMLGRWGYGDRYFSHQHDIIKEHTSEKADCAINVEVLEHLEDPVTFLKSLKHMVKFKGYAFVTVAIDAPNKDHIYLYRDLKSVRKELNAAGFEVIAERNFPAFGNPKPSETVPQNGSFIVQAT